MARVGAVRHPWRTFRDSRPRRLRGGVRLSIFGIGTCLLVDTVGAGALAAPLLLAGEGGAKRRVRVRRFAAPGADARCSYPCAVTPTTFPIDTLLPQVRESLMAHPRLVLEDPPGAGKRSEEHTSELRSLMRISYAVF